MAQTGGPEYPAPLPERKKKKKRKDKERKTMKEKEREELRMKSATGSTNIFVLSILLQKLVNGDTSRLHQLIGFISIIE